MEKILRITETTFISEKNDWQQYDGYRIVTDKQDIMIGVSNSQNCCESWGYFTSEDDFSGFIGAEIISITITDSELKTGLVEKNGADYLDEGDIMFVNINTNKGTLQFAAYNGHNGYYGHTGVVISDQLKEFKPL